MSSTPFVSIIVVSSRPNMLRNLLKCLENQIFEDFEIIVVCIIINQQYKKITSRFGVRLFEDKGKGVCRARNIGLKNAEGKIVIFLDDDVTFGIDWIQLVLDIFNLYPYIGGLGGRPIPPRETFIPVSLFRYLNNIIQGISNWDMPPNSQKEVNTLSGSNMVFYRDVLMTVGGSDENFYGPCAGEDTDLCLRISSMGFELLLDSRLDVYHHSNFVKRTLTNHRKDPFYFFALSDNDTYWRVKNQILKGLPKWLLYVFTSIMYAMFWMLLTCNLKTFFYYMRGIVNGFLRSKQSFFRAQW